MKIVWNRASIVIATGFSVCCVLNAVAIMRGWY